MTGDSVTINGETARARRLRLGTAIRFGLAGIANTLFGYGVFASLILLGCPPFLALLLANIAGVAWNFHTSKRFVFRNGGHGRIWRFVALYLALLVINWLALRLLHNFGLTELLAQALLVGPLAVVSYIGQRSFVFHQDRN